MPAMMLMVNRIIRPSRKTGVTRLAATKLPTRFRVVDPTHPCYLGPVDLGRVPRLGSPEVRLAVLTRPDEPREGPLDVDRGIDAIWRVFDLTGSLRAAADLARCLHRTVAGQGRRDRAAGVPAEHRAA